MSQYIVNISPVTDTTSEANPIPEATVRIDVQDGQVLVRELTIRAPEGSGLATAEPPYVDFELLLKAFARPEQGGEAKPDTSVDTPPRTEPVQKPPVARVRRSGKTTSDAKRPARTDGARQLGSGRVYRRAPEPDVLMEAYEQTGSIAGVADKFGVPAHTAQGWISRLRQKNAQDVHG